MNILEIIGRNYYATRRRGQITEKTNELDFIVKIEEETKELLESVGKSNIHPFDIEELADIILVCFSMARHFGYDIISVLIRKMLFNEKRKD